MDGSRIRKEKVADSKISRYVWTGPNFDAYCGEILGFGAKKKNKTKQKQNKNKKQTKQERRGGGSNSYAKKITKLAHLAFERCWVVPSIWQNFIHKGEMPGPFSSLPGPLVNLVLNVKGDLL